VITGGASTVKEPGHFQGHKVLQPGHPDALFSQKKLDDFFLVVALKTQAASQRRFTVKIKQIKRSDMVTFLFSVHTVTEAKQ